MEKSWSCGRFSVRGLGRWTCFDLLQVLAFLFAWRTVSTGMIYDPMDTSPGDTGIILSMVTGVA
jgi:hypothetical protein